MLDTAWDHLHKLGCQLRPGKRSNSSRLSEPGWYGPAEEPVVIASILYAWGSMWLVLRESSLVIGGHQRPDVRDPNSSAPSQ
jgi:hypothetical protein